MHTLHLAFVNDDSGVGQGLRMTVGHRWLGILQPCVVVAVVESATQERLKERKSVSKFDNNEIWFQIFLCSNYYCIISVIIGLNCEIIIVMISMSWYFVKIKRCELCQALSME